MYELDWIGSMSIGLGQQKRTHVQLCFNSGWRYKFRLWIAATMSTGKMRTADLRMGYRTWARCSCVQKKPNLNINNPNPKF